MCRKLKMLVSAFCELCFFDIRKIELMSSYKCKLTIRTNLVVEFSVQKSGSKDYTLDIWLLTDNQSSCYRTSYSNIESIAQIIRALDSNNDYDFTFDFVSIDDLFRNRLSFNFVYFSKK